MTSCVTIQEVKPILPPKPVRPELNPPESDDDFEWELYYNRSIDSLEYTITLWENWAEFVEKTLGN
jgi:hypothetical protein